MKLLIFAALVAIACGEYLDSDNCSKGAEFWCTNLHYARKCDAVKYCTDNVWSKEKLVGAGVDASCTVCQLMVNNARQLINNKATEEEISTLISKSCDVMPSSVVAKECRSAVKDYLPELLTLISNQKFDSKMICSLVGMCRGTEDTAVRQRKLVIPVVKDIPKVGDKLCDDCVNFMGDIRNLIISNVTEEEFVGLVDDYLCKKLGGLEGLCHQLVQTYAPAIFQYLGNEFNAQELCSTLQFCTSQVNYHRLQALIKASRNSSEECSICKDVINELRNLVRDQQIQQTLADLLNNHVCTLLGPSVNACREYVKTYLPVLFELLASELDSDELCSQLGLCTSIKQSVKATLIQEAFPISKVKEPLNQKNVDASIECVVCEFVLKEVVDIIGENRSQAVVKAALDKVCDLLPTTIRTECVNFVNQYTSIVVLLLSQDIDPQQVCTFIGLCAKQSKQTSHLFSILKVLKPIESKTVSKKVKASPLCSTCKLVVNYVDTLLKENVTEQEIKITLDKFCGILPSTFRNECLTIVNQYEDTIIQLLTQLIDPLEVCQALTLCSAQKMTKHVNGKQHKENTLYFKPHLIGTEKCTYGPSFWCASHENAKRCSAVEHCRKHVWNK